MKKYIFVWGAAVMLMVWLSGIPIRVGATAAVAPDNITVTNNAEGVPDLITVSGVSPGDIIRVYNSFLPSAVPIGGAIAGDTTAKVYIYQLGAAAGSVYVTVTGADNTESIVTAKEYGEEPVTPGPNKSKITVIRSGSIDVVNLSGLSEGDVVRIYSSSTGTTPAGSAAADKKGYASVSLPTAGTRAGVIYVSVTRTGMLESLRAGKEYPAEVSAPPLTADITVVNNNSGTQDRIDVNNLAAGDVVKAYASSTAPTPIGTAEAAATASGSLQAAIYIDQLGEEEGTVYVTITNPGKPESVRVAKAYATEVELSMPSPALAADAITLSNNYKDVPDVITITGLRFGDMVRVYETATGTTPLASMKNETPGNTDMIITLNQMGIKEGILFLSVQSGKRPESTRTAKSYKAEPVADAPSIVTVANHVAGKQDIVTVKKLLQGDSVQIYSAPDSASPFASAKADSTGTAVVYCEQLGTKAGTVYVSVTTPGKHESYRAPFAYAAEPVSPAPEDIAVENCIAGIQDTVTVSNLSAGDIVKIYRTSTDTAPILTGTVREDSTSVALQVDQLGVQAGVIYVTVTRTDMLESPRTVKNYAAEPVTAAPENIVITNNFAGIPDTIVVSELNKGDIVRVYKTPTAAEPVKTATAEENAVTITIDQLGVRQGLIYISRTSSAKLESARTVKAYPAEPVFSPLNPESITVTNNREGTPDTIAIDNVPSGYTVEVYSTATSTVPLGIAKAVDSKATVYVYQLGSGEGTVYITLKYEGYVVVSLRVAKNYDAEPVTPAPAADAISVGDNPEGMFVILYVTGISADDFVKVYRSAEETVPVCSAVAAGSPGTAAVLVFRSEQGEETVYVTVTAPGALESVRVPVVIPARAGS